MDMVKKVLSEHEELLASRIQTAIADEPQAVWRSTAGDDDLVYCKTGRYQYAITQVNFNDNFEGKLLINLISALYDAVPMEH